MFTFWSIGDDAKVVRARRRPITIKPVFAPSARGPQTPRKADSDQHKPDRKDDRCGLCLADPLCAKDKTVYSLPPQMLSVSFARFRHYSLWRNIKMSSHVHPELRLHSFPVLSVLPPISLLSHFHSVLSEPTCQTLEKYAQQDNLDLQARASTSSTL